MESNDPERKPDPHESAEAELERLEPAGDEDRLRGLEELHSKLERELDPAEDPPAS